MKELTKETLKIDRFEDQNDVKKFLATVDSNLLQSKVGVDFTLAKLEPKQREFIIEQTKIAFILKRHVPDITIGNNIFDMIMAENYMMVVLHRNLDKNSLLEIIGDARRATEEETPEKIDGKKAKEELTKNEEKTR